MLMLATSKYVVRNPKLKYLDLELMSDFEKYHNLPLTHTMVDTNLRMLRNDNVKTHVNHVFAPDPLQYRIAKNLFAKSYMTIVDSSDPIGFDQAISECEKNSSPGFYYTKVYHCVTKGELFTKWPNHFKESILSISKGEDRMVIWQNGPKSEIRAIEKVTSPDISDRKQRTFLCSDPLFYLVGVMLWHNQNLRILDKAYSPRSYSAAGVSIFHGCWDRFARVLLSTGINRFRCKDVSAMEASCSLPLLEHIYHVRSARYRRKPIWRLQGWDEDINVLRLCEWWVRNLIYSIVLDVDGNFWLSFGQNPSGQNNTLYNNIETLTIVFYYCLAQGCFNDEDCEKKIEATLVKLMGDDSIFPDHPYLSNIDEQSTHLGFKLTDEIVGAQPLENCTFCGFSFAYRSCARIYSYAPVPNINKILSSSLYNRKNNSYRFAFVKLAALKVLLYGTDYYDWVCRMLALYQDKYMVNMIAEIQYDKVLPLASCVNSVKSDVAIQRLIYGME
jgi:hypothetical protein